jgi:hypothetical protein
MQVRVTSARQAKEADFVSGENRTFDGRGFDADTHAEARGESMQGGMVVSMLVPDESRGARAGTTQTTAEESSAPSLSQVCSLYLHA